MGEPTQAIMGFLFAVGILVVLPLYMIHLESKQREDDAKISKEKDK